MHTCCGKVYVSHVNSFGMPAPVLSNNRGVFLKIYFFEGGISSTVVLV